MMLNNQVCPSPATMPYTVQIGDTLNSIAFRFGINLTGLIDLNPTLRLRTLTEGMVLCVPRVPVTPPCINGALYVVKEGDSFYMIALRNRVSLNALLESNPDANPYDLKVGQEICIPDVREECPFGTLVTIQESTRLSDILINYNLSVNELLASNPGFNPNILVPGNEICIPPYNFQPCEEGSTEYVIKANDSLSTVALQFSMPISELLLANPYLRPANFMIIGTVICIPNRETIG